MRILKRIFVSALLVVVVLLLTGTGVYLFVNDATLVPLLSNYLETVSETRITFDKDASITRTLSPSLHVNNLVVEDENNYFYAHVRSLQFQVSLPSLFLGKFEVPLLALSDTRIEIKQSDSSNTVSIPESLPLIPIFHDIQVSKLAIHHEGEKILSSATQLSALSVSLDPDTDKFVFLVDIELADNRIVHVNATLPQIRETLKTKQLSFTASAKSSDIDLSTQGNIDLKSSSPGVQASVSLLTPDLKRFSTGIKDFVAQGSLTGEAEFAGTFDQLAVKGISASWKGPGQSAATVSGSIDNVMQLSGCELKVDGRLEKSAWLAPVLPDSMGILQSADITAQVSSTDKQMDIRDFSLHIKTVDALDLSLAGQLNLVHHKFYDFTPENIDLKLEFSAPTTRTARVLFFENIWEFGAITGMANIRSLNGDLAIEDVSIEAKDSQGIEVDLAGRIAQFPLDPDRSSTGYDLDVTMKSDKTSVMAERFDFNLPMSGPLEVMYKIEGASQALQLNEINLTAGKEEGIHVSTTGSLLFGNWDLDDPLANIDLTVQATSNDTQALEALLGQHMPDLGPLAAQALLHTVSGKHRIDNFRIQTTRKSLVQASVKGSADHITFFDQPGVHGVQLTVEATADDTALFNSIFGFQKAVPAIGPFKAIGDITGSHERLTLSNFTATAGKEETLFIDIQGKPGIFSAASDWHPKETDISILAQSNSSSPFFDLLGYHLPELGPIKANAIIKEKEKKLMVESSNIVIGDTNNPVLEANGHINDLFASKDIGLAIKLNLDGHSFAALSDDITLPDMKPLVGEIIISDNDSTLGIDRFHVESIDEKLLSFEATGLFDDFKDPHTLSLTTRLTAKNLLLIGALFDLQWPEIGPVQLDSKIHKKGKSLKFDTTFAAGEMKIYSEISGLFHRTPPQIAGKITAHDFFLPSLPDIKAEGSKNKKPKKDHVFSKEPINFNWLKKADLDLSLDIDSFDAQRFKAESGQFKIVVQSGNLKVSPAKLVYPKGELDLDIDLEAKGQPKVRFEAYGKDLNPWLALDKEDSIASKEFDAELDIEVEVTSSGVSEHELAANMQGEIYMNMKKGKMLKSLLDLIFLDFAGWTVSKVTRNKYTDVECGVADYTVKDGVVDTKALFLDTKSISVAGKGTIDLADEKIDYVLLPRKKSRLIKRADPVHIKGFLNNPSIRIIPWKTAVTTYGTWFFAPYLFVGVWAADLFIDTVKIRAKKNPCLEYERKHDQEHEADEHGTQP